MLSSMSWKVSQYGVFSGSYFPVFCPNSGKSVPEETPYLDTFLAVHGISFFVGRKDIIYPAQSRQGTIVFKKGFLLHMTLLS